MQAKYQLSRVDPDAALMLPEKAFLELKRSEMRPDDQLALYGFMDAHEQLKIEKSLLAGHVRLLQDMMAERNFKPDMDTRRLLNEIRNAA